jgi:three-Cys-motif partner protein
MADPKEAVYPADPHTTAKHHILEEYLKRWLPILAKQSQRVGGTNGRLLYVDGFAGAGEYIGNIPGSPLVAIQTALQQCQNFRVPVQIKLIELRHDRAVHLQKIVAERRSGLGNNQKLIIDDPIEGDCEAEIHKLITEHEQTRRKLGPALFFLDQFGYSSFSMDLIGRILKNDVCEVFSYLNWNLLHPFMTDQTKWVGITKAFGGEEWRKVLGLNGKQKEDLFRDVYVHALRTRAGAKFSYPFAMRDNNNRVIYWLFFCSNNIRGLEEMKKAMWQVDRSGSFEFSDKHATQHGKLFSYNEQALAAALESSLDGREMTVAEIQEYVLLNTPACNFKSALQNLERRGVLTPIKAPPSRRSCSFTDDTLRVRIAKKKACIAQQPTLFG